jgi:type I restriction enzyme S subunit
MKTWQGSLGISRVEGIVSPAYFVCKQIGDGDPNFLHYLLRSQSLIYEYGKRSKGIRPSQWDLPWDEFREIKVRLPPADRQRAIAGYLDAETARIEALIEKKHRMVHLFGERWRVAVTCRMTELEEQHGTIQLRHLVTCLDGDRVPVSAVERAHRGGDYPYYGASGVVDHIDDYLFDETLVLLGEDGAQLGDPSSLIAQLVAGRIWVNNHAHVLRPVDVDPTFLVFFLNTFDRVAFTSGGTREKITQDDMNRILVPNVPLEVGRVEAGRMERAVSQSNQCSDAIRRQLDLLLERRQALITAAVTGGLDVTGKAA